MFGGLSLSTICFPSLSNISFIIDFFCFSTLLRKKINRGKVLSRLSFIFIFDNFLLSTKKVNNQSKCIHEDVGQSISLRQTASEVQRLFIVLMEFIVSNI